MYGLPSRPYRRARWWQGVMRLDILQDIYQALEIAIAEDKTGGVGLPKY